MLLKRVGNNGKEHEKESKCYHWHAVRDKQNRRKIAKQRSKNAGLTFASNHFSLHTIRLLSAQNNNKNYTEQRQQHTYERTKQFFHNIFFALLCVILKICKTNEGTQQASRWWWLADKPRRVWMWMWMTE